MTIKYKHNPIASKGALAKKLGITEEYLNEILIHSDLLYHANTPEKKSDGSLRQTYRVEEKLKIILRKIVTNIFHHVSFPRYIQGSIKDKEQPRDYISNASVHTGRRVLIKEDIKNFFPSIKSLEVEKIWRRLFNFTPEVANALTKLTTLNGSVPQGAPTSSYLANLIFWDVEPSVVANLSNLGITYSRYVDDITLSTNRRLSHEEKTEVIKLIYGMCLKKGIKPNRKKHVIMNNSQKMTVHGLNVNSKVPTLSKYERQNLRAAVYQCKLEFQSDGYTQEYKKLYEKTVGRIQRLNRLQPSQAKPLLFQLKEIEPVI